MLKSKILAVVMTLVLALSFCLTAVAADTAPVLPTLKLSVQQSPLAVYPPIMVYTAQLSFVPPVISNTLKVDFYNVGNSTDPALLIYLGSASVDKSGKAVLSKQMKPGKYTGVSKIIINSNTIWSNKVDYLVQ